MTRNEFEVKAQRALNNCMHYEEELFKAFVSYVEKSLWFDNEPEVLLYYIEKEKPVPYVSDADSTVLFQLKESAPEKIAGIINNAKSEETFSDMLIRIQNSLNMTGPQLYKSCGIDARHFSKIISDRYYQPKKETVFALAIGLKLDIRTTEKFLSRAGYAFNTSSIFDMTIRYFIQSENYDRADIDSLMESFNLQLLPQNW